MEAHRTDRKTASARDKTSPRDGIWTGHFLASSLFFVWVLLPAIGFSQPTILRPPTSQTTNVGDRVTFSIGVRSSWPATLIYAWKFKGGIVATTSSYTINKVQSNDAGTYTVNVHDRGGDAPPANATLTVLQPEPMISQQPVNQTVQIGGNAVFSVVATGTDPLSYQWQYNGTNLADGGSIYGSTTSILSISNAQPTYEGSYSVTVTNLGGAITSEPAILLVDTNTTVRMRNASYTNDDLSFQVTGPVGTYVVQVSTNLVDWYSTATNSIPVATNLWWNYTDVGAAALDRRFYRAYLQMP